MKNMILDEFVAYVEDKYGYTINIEKTSTPDSFESIFGMSFLKQKEEDFYFPEGECIELEYRTEKIEVEIDFSKVLAGNDFIAEINFAA